MSKYLLPSDEDELAISKEVLQELPPGYEVTLLGEPRGAIQQYRGPSGLHVREYEDRFVIHQDRVDPRIDPLGHLLVDASETGMALATAFCLTIGKKELRSSGQMGDADQKETSSPLLFLPAFLSLNHLLKFIKRLLF